MEVVFACRDQLIRLQAGQSFQSADTVAIETCADCRNSTNLRESSHRNGIVEPVWRNAGMTQETAKGLWAVGHGQQLVGVADSLRCQSSQQFGGQADEFSQGGPLGGYSL